jgi:Methionine synthase I, cobalamin-binding domain
MFSGCSQAAIFLATIGEELEGRVAQLMKEGSMLEALIADSIGSAAVEKVADWFENEIRIMAVEKGDKVGWRYSPGYCDWDIMQQKDLFRVFDSKSIGVNLTSECLMVPRKSISGIMGIGKFCITSSACRFCNKKDCPTRREEFIA